MSPLKRFGKKTLKLFKEKSEVLKIAQSAAANSDPDAQTGSDTAPDGQSGPDLLPDAQTGQDSVSDAQTGESTASAPVSNSAGFRNISLARLILEFLSLGRNHRWRNFRIDGDE